MSFAATLATEKVAQTISGGVAGVFMHGPTFMGNPLACAVPCASVDLLTASPWREFIRRIEQQMSDELEDARNHKEVSDVRTLGAIGVIETRKPVDVGKIQSMFVKEGIWVRPFGKNIYIMPPYIIESDQLTKLTTGILKVIHEYYG